MMANTTALPIGRFDPCPRIPLPPHETGLSDAELDLLCDIALIDLKLENRDAKVARDLRRREDVDKAKKRR